MNDEVTLLPVALDPLVMGWFNTSDALVVALHAAAFRTVPRIKV